MDAIGSQLMQDLEKQRERQEREMMSRSMQSQMYPQQTARQTALNTELQTKQTATDAGEQQKMTSLPTNLQPGQTVPLQQAAPIQQLKTQPLATSTDVAMQQKLQAEQLRSQLESGAMQNYLQQANPTPAPTPAIMQQEQARFNQQSDLAAVQQKMQAEQEQQARQQEQYMIQQRMQQALSAENQRHQMAMANIQQMKSL